MKIFLPNGIMVDNSGTESYPLVYLPKENKEKFDWS